MPRPPLNPGGGTAARIEARMPDGDYARLVALAACRGIRQPVLIRELISLALDQFEDGLAEPEPLSSG